MTRLMAVIALLSDGRWHTPEELAQITADYRSRLHEAKQRGYGSVLLTIWRGAKSDADVSDE